MTLLLSCKYSKSNAGRTFFWRKSEWQKFPISQKEFIDYTMQEMIDLPPNCEEEKKKGIY